MEMVKLGIPEKENQVKLLPGTSNLKMWAAGDSSQSMGAVDPDKSLKTGAPQKMRLKGKPRMLSDIGILMKDEEFGGWVSGVFGAVRGRKP